MTCSRTYTTGASAIMGTLCDVMLYCITFLASFASILLCGISSRTAQEQPTPSVVLAILAVYDTKGWVLVSVNAWLVTLTLTYECVLRSHHEAVLQCHRRRDAPQTSCSAGVKQAVSGSVSWLKNFRADLRDNIRVVKEQRGRAGTHKVYGILAARAHCLDGYARIRASLVLLVNTFCSMVLPFCWAWRVAHSLIVKIITAAHITLKVYMSDKCSNRDVCVVLVYHCYPFLPAIPLVGYMVKQLAEEVYGKVDGATNQHGALSANSGMDNVDTTLTLRHTQSIESFHQLSTRPKGRPINKLPQRDRNSLLHGNQDPIELHVRAGPAAQEAEGSNNESMEDNKGAHQGIKGSNEPAGAAAESTAATANTELTHMSPEQPLALLDQASPQAAKGKGSEKSPSSVLPRAESPVAVVPRDQVSPQGASLDAGGEIKDKGSKKSPVSVLPPSAPGSAATPAMSHQKALRVRASRFAVDMGASQQYLDLFHSPAQDLHRSMAARAKARPLTPVPFDAVIEDDGWEDCPFSSDVEVYRWPKAGSYLGGGATAQVFWAERMRGPDGPLAEPERVAVKRVQPTMDGLDRDIIEHEASVLRALAGKPFTTPLYHMHLPPPGITDAYGYLVMGLVQGKDMYSLCTAAHEAGQRLEPGPQLDALRAWSWKVGMQFTLYMLKCVYFSHAEGHYHRDLKPQNVMVSNWSGAKLSAKIVDWASSRHESQGRCNGGFTAGFASPELLPFLGKECHESLHDRRNDVWALGVMIHRVLTCMLPQWQLAFDLLPEEREAFAAVPAAEQEAFGREALLRRQAHWAKSHSRGRMTPDDAELHPIEGAVYQAASVASADPREAADIVTLLRVLLHPDSEVRGHAIVSSLNPTLLPLLFAANLCVLPECPIVL